MPYVSLNDLIANCPNELVANSIIIFDGCHWVLQQIPDGITCEDVLDCIDCEYLLSVLTFSTGLLVDSRNGCTISVNPEWINSIITASLSCSGTPTLTIGTQDIDLSCLLGLRTIGFQDGVDNFFVSNMNQITIVGNDGLRFRVSNPSTLNIGLPIGATNGQVLTWNTETSSAYRSSFTDLCCDRVYTCMTPIITGLQNQINIIAGQLCPCGAGEGTPLSIYEEGLLVHAQVSMLNFIGNNILAERNAGTGQVDISVSIPVTFSGCEGLTPYQLSVGGAVVDLSCLADVGCPCPIEVNKTAFVMENGDNITGTIGRFDLPYVSVSKAISDGAEYIIMYAGEYGDDDSIDVNQQSVTIYAHPGVSYKGSFNIMGNYAKLHIYGHMNWNDTDNDSNLQTYVKIEDPTAVTTTDGYDININVNYINLSDKVLVNVADDSMLNTGIYTYLSFNFASKYSYRRFISNADDFIINIGDREDTRVETKRFNISLGYFSIYMSAGDTVSEYTPKIYLTNVGESNNVRLHHTTIQEDKHSVNGPNTHDFGGAVGIRSKCGQIGNKIRYGGRMEIEEFNITGNFTAIGYGEEFPLDALFTLTSNNDETRPRLHVKNCTWVLSKEWEDSRDYTLFNVKTQDDEVDSIGLITFEGNNTFHISQQTASEFTYSLPASNAIAHTYIQYWSSTGFVITNLLFQVGALTANQHTHGGYKHIICTADEPATGWLDPQVAVDYSF